MSDPRSPEPAPDEEAGAAGGEVPGREVAGAAGEASGAADAASGAGAASGLADAASGADAAADAASGDRAALTAAERGDTLSPARRLVVRAAVIAAIAGGVAASVLLARGVLEEVPHLVLELTPWSSSGPAVALGPTPDASAVPSAGTAAGTGSGASASPAAPGGTPTPTSTFSPYPYDEESQRLADTAARDDAAWPVLARSGEVRDLVAGQFVALAPRDTPYSLDDLIAQGAAQRIDDRTVLVTQLVFVRPGASLVIDSPGTTIRLASHAGAAPARIVAWGASLTLSGTPDAPLTIVGWDDSLDEPDVDASDSRVYIRVESGSLTASDVALSDLGYWGGPTGGLAVTGTPSTLSSGSLTRVTTDGLHIGLYADDTTALTVTDSRFASSAEQGVLLGTRATGTSLDGVTVTGSGADGILVRQGVDDLSIAGGEVSGSGRWGLFADGTPRADGPNPNGYGVANSTGFSIDGTSFHDDAFGAISIEGTSGVVVTGTDVDERGIGIRLTDSQGAVDGNAVRVADGRGIVFSGALTSTRASGNTLSGSGPAAVSVEGGAADVDQLDNSTGDWSVKWEILIWIEQHPLALLWALVLVIPVLGVAFIAVRMRRQRRIRELVESTTIALARAEKEQYEAALRGEPERVGAADPLLAQHGLAEEISPLLAESERLDADAELVVEPVTAAAAPIGAAARAGDEASPAASPTGTTWLVGGPITGTSGRWARAAAAPRAERPDSRGSGAPAARPAVSAPPPRLRAAAAANGAARHETTSAVESAVVSSGRFTSVEELAAAAVLDGGKPIDSVARTLRVPTATVAGWVARARRLRGLL
ncbi:right-handed parallel beta-helix repeat-containing protein [Humibacter sp. BT305]|nr:right-handed parallel beta-helix repeat-containing protein [Humibacter sp. BT305]